MTSRTRAAVAMASMILAVWYVIPATPASAAPSPLTLDSEQLQSTSASDGSVAGCDGPDGTFSFNVSGIASAPLVGSFTETGTVTLSGGSVTSASATFVISSPSASATGSITSDPSSASDGYCVPGVFGSAYFAGSYTATVTDGTGESTQDSGNVSTTASGGPSAYSAIAEQFVHPPPPPPLLAEVSYPAALLAVTVVGVVLFLRWRRRTQSTVKSATLDS